jgi:hypothetical protein
MSGSILGLAALSDELAQSADEVGNIALITYEVGGDAAPIGRRLVPSARSRRTTGSDVHNPARPVGRVVRPVDHGDDDRGIADRLAIKDGQPAQGVSVTLWLATS